MKKGPGRPPKKNSFVNDKFLDNNMIFQKDFNNNLLQHFKSKENINYNVSNNIYPNNSHVTSNDYHEETRKSQKLKLNDSYLRKKDKKKKKK